MITLAVRINQKFKRQPKQILCNMNISGQFLLPEPCGSNYMCLKLYLDYFREQVFTVNFIAVCDAGVSFIVGNSSTEKPKRLFAEKLKFMCDK